MNSVVMTERATSVMSRSCLAMRERRRSKGPSKLLRLTRKPGSCSTTSCSGSCATGDQLSGELAVGLCGRVLRGEGGDRSPGDTGIGKLHRAADDRLEHRVAEGLDHALEHLARVQRAG